jgi:agmatinase
MNSDLFVPPLTFLNRPFSTDFAGADVAILGIPYDCARDEIRVGPRLGPNAVRHASILIAKLMGDASPSPFDSLRVIDCGNVNLSLEDIGQAFSQIEAAMDEILDGGCIPITVGGDGAVSLPQMRSLNKKHGEFAVLHFDAHTDAWPVDSDNPFTNANQFTHAVTEKLIDMDASIHVGTRGPINADVAIAHARNMGYEVIPFDDYRKWDEERLIEHLRERVGNKPVFICYDMDFFDPGVAPGVATPTPGGALAAEGIALLRGMKGLNIIAIDINTTAPIHDPSGATAGLAAALIAEGLGVLTSP